MWVMISSAALSVLALSPALVKGPYPLMVGDPAPELRTAGWLRGEPVPNFQRGKVYVIDLWATWCVPCIRDFPKLSALQEELGDKATIIGVSVWEPDWKEVPTFIQKKSDAARYRIATDYVPPSEKPLERFENYQWAKDKGHFATRWLKDSGYDSIPTTYIVDQQGRIAWIGLGAEVKKPLQAVVDGTWNLRAASEKHHSRMEKLVRGRQWRGQLAQAEQQKNWAEAIRLCNLINELYDPEFSGVPSRKFKFMRNSLGQKGEALNYAVQEQAGGKLGWDAVWSFADVILAQQDASPAELEVALKFALDTERLSPDLSLDVLELVAMAYHRNSKNEEAIDYLKKALALADGEAKKRLEGVLAEWERPR
jgi:thiol-disulfide isomerase/thioredoxin